MVIDEYPNAEIDYYINCGDSYFTIENIDELLNESEEDE